MLVLVLLKLEGVRVLIRSILVEILMVRMFQVIVSMGVRLVHLRLVVLQAIEESFRV